ncbi:spermidine/putrescine import ATP-binding protein PotA [Clostridium tepidiprofundi DSM 19306]|uniref:Spermidine/putrescine import ATP-binding protein PotA n=1 Tax=Clostridium tepidiprofundi DSM 19306 TaxID=1121338 RepID=A0A151B2J0_9CLOT|nr:ABC transporter ATP-binding protein [Clostridium tepidiprofundi]KYH33982.1 spermidine/putrescine import ATP-binding protein PotA [Clostridium tepidiprofundi DSM 19306]
MSELKNVVLKNIVKTYLGNDGKPFTAVNNINLEIKSGEFVTLLGPSGCGKTTTLRMIAGFEIPTSGDIYIGKENVSKLTPDKRDTAMVFQSYALFPHLNIFDNVAYGLKLKKLSKDVIDKKVRKILELVGLNGLEERAPNQLSGGQQQRVALARALVMEPSVLLFDEPLSNLDAKLRVYMRTEIRRIQKEVGITSVYVTHDQAEAMSMSDRIIIMNKGVIEQIGTPKEIYEKPATKFVADFIGEANILEAEIVDIADKRVNIKLADKIFSVKTDLNVGKEDKINIVIRPEAVNLVDNGDIEVNVKSSVFMGAYQDYVIELDNKEIKLVQYDPQHKKVYNTGEKAYIDLKANSIHVIRN